MEIAKTTQEQRSHATHWSTRSMAAAAGISEVSVRRIWSSHELKPHRVETFKKGRAQTLTHDYKRHGATTLFAALNTLDGRVMATCMERHRHQEWLRFLRLIDRQTPADKQHHLIVDNYATHKHPAVQRWAARHKRFHFHFTPTSSSRLNMVERFFRDPTENQLRRGISTSVEELGERILAYIEEHNREPKPSPGLKG